MAMESSGRSVLTRAGENIGLCFLVDSQSKDETVFIVLYVNSGAAVTAATTMYPDRFYA